MQLRMRKHLRELSEMVHTNQPSSLAAMFPNDKLDDGEKIA